MIGIYKITNLATGDFYIGQTKNTDRRWKDHFSSWIAQAHSRKFQQDIDRYGKDGFRCELIQECREEELLLLEKEWIAKLNPTYNSVYDGHEVSDETREKIRKALTGTKQPIEVVNKRKASIKEYRKTHPQTNFGHRKKIAVQFDEVLEFDSVKSAAEYMGVDPSTITHALKRCGNVKGKKVWYVV